MKTKALISFAFTAKLICVFVFAYANSRFSQDAAHLALNDLVVLEKMFKNNGNIHVYIPGAGADHIKHNVVSSLVTVCPSQSYFHGFLGLTSTKQGVNMACSRPQQMATRSGLEPWTPWIVVHDANHCASPPPPCLNIGKVQPRVII